MAILESTNKGDFPIAGLKIEKILEATPILGCGPFSLLPVNAQIHWVNLFFYLGNQVYGQYKIMLNAELLNSWLKKISVFKQDEEITLFLNHPGFEIQWIIQRKPGSNPKDDWVCAVYVDQGIHNGKPPACAGPAILLSSNASQLIDFINAIKFECCPKL